MKCGHCGPGTSSRRAGAYVVPSVVAGIRERDPDDGVVQAPYVGVVALAPLRPVGFVGGLERRAGDGAGEAIHHGGEVEVHLSLIVVKHVPHEEVPRDRPCGQVHLFQPLELLAQPTGVGDEVLLSLVSVGPRQVVVGVVEEIRLAQVARAAYDRWVPAFDDHGVAAHIGEEVAILAVDGFRIGEMYLGCFLGAIREAKDVHVGEASGNRVAPIGEGELPGPVVNVDESLAVHAGMRREATKARHVVRRGYEGIAGLRKHHDRAGEKPDIVVAVAGAYQPAALGRLPPGRESAARGLLGYHEGLLRPG